MVSSTYELGAVTVIIALGVCFAMPGLVALALGLVKRAAGKDNGPW